MNLLRRRTLKPIDRQRLSRLHAVARAALEGRLDIDVLTGMPFDEARQSLLQIRGVGPWTADAVLVRGCSLTDALALAEPRLHAIVGAHYGLGGAASDAQLLRIADAWRPFRTWASVLLVSESFSEAVRGARVRPAFTRGKRAA